MDECARRHGWGTCRTPLPERRARFADTALAVETNNFWWVAQSAEHEQDSAVLAKVRDGFDPTACQVEVSDFVRVEYAQGVQTLPRTVDVSLTRLKAL